MNFPMLFPAVFLERCNRFVALCGIQGKICRTHVPNTGRLRELLLPGATVMVKKNPPGGKTEYTLCLVQTSRGYVSIDSANVPNRVVEEALQAHQLPFFPSYDTVRREAALGNSRMDFALYSGKSPCCYIEVKGVTLVEGATALFPDAPTLRGRKHLQELREAALSGMPAALLFVIQRSDAALCSPNETNDPAFAKALREAAKAGVALHALLLEVTPRYARILTDIPVKL